MISFRSIILTVAFVLASCGGCSSNNVPPSLDVTTDASVDVTVEASSDVAVDVDATVNSDVVVDAASDASVMD